MSGDGKFEIVILPDGRIKIVTGDMGEEVQHLQAEGLLKALLDLTGAKGLDVVRTAKPGATHHHDHEHGHGHDHGHARS